MTVKKISETIEDIRNRMHLGIAKRTDLDGVDLRVFLYLTTKLNFELPVHISQIQIAMDMDKYKPHISRSIRKLMQSGIIVPSEKGPRSSEWMFNPKFGK